MGQPRADPLPMDALGRARGSPARAGRPGQGGLFPFTSGSAKLPLPQCVANLFQQDFLTRRGRVRGRGWRLLQLVDAFDRDENHEGDDEEVEYRLKERAVLEQYGRALGVVAHSHRKVAEVDAADQHAERRHDDVADQGGNDLAERGADDDADRQVDHVAFHGKFFELAGDTHGVTAPFGVSMSTAFGNTWESAPASSCGFMPNFAASPEIASEPNTACT